MNNNKKVLIVDDERDLLDMTSEYLADEDFQVLSVDNGEEALEIVDKEKPDVILLDLTMPGIDGFEVLKRLKATPDTSGIPVIILTIIDLEDCRKKCFDLGASYYLTKPVSREKLLKTIDEFMEG